MLKDNSVTINFGYISAGLSVVSLLVAMSALLIQIKKHPMLLTSLSYLFITSTIAAFIVEAGDKATSYQYALLWAIVAVFTAVFGFWMYVYAITLLGAFVAFQYLSGDLSGNVIISDLIAGPMPLILSFFIFRLKSEPSAENKTIKNLTTELTQVASQSEVIINAIGDGVLAIDRKGVVTLINPAAQEITGWNKANALSLNYSSILQFTDIRGNQVPNEKNPVQMVLNTNQEVIDNSLILITKSGKKIMVSILVSPLGEIGSGAIAVFRDITKQKAEENAQAEFISTASHEMRTPVASIEGYLGLALNPQTASIDEKAREFITKAHESAQHLGRLFQDLLDVTKADDQRLANQPKVVDIMQLTRDIVMGLQAKASEKKIELVFKPQPDSSNRYVAPVYYVNLDNDHLREILGNLVENGIKYTIHGSVTVDVVGTDQEVKISVQDTGIGIPDEDIPHLFQKFYRVNNTETNQIGGTGLGLYLSRRLTEILGGRIWVESVYHQGSTFFVEFPRISNEQARSLMAEQARQVTTPQPLQQITGGSAMPMPTLQTIAPSSGPTRPAEVPRGENLTAAQKAEQIAKLQALAKSQNGSAGGRPLVGQPVVTSRTSGVVVPARKN